MQKTWITRKAIIVVRTYPTPARKGVEVSCTAAISDAGEWLRLFPVPYRFLSPDKRFRKYQWIEVNTVKSSNDSRPESNKINDQTIQILSEPLSTSNGWLERKKIILPLKSHCLCCLEKQRAVAGSPTLGIFRPRVINSLSITGEREKEWSQEQTAILTQGSLFDEGPRERLEKIPYRFAYQFYCDEQSCKGHDLMCTDWEMGQSWRNWRDKYGDDWESKFRHRYFNDMVEINDTHFFVGTMHGHPNRWIIVGLFYPPNVDQGMLDI